MCCVRSAVLRRCIADSYRVTVYDWITTARAPANVEASTPAHVEASALANVEAKAPANVEANSNAGPGVGERTLQNLKQFSKMTDMRLDRLVELSSEAKTDWSKAKMDRRELLELAIAKTKQERGWDERRARE